MARGDSLSRQLQPWMPPDRERALFVDDVCSLPPGQLDLELRVPLSPSLLARCEVSKGQVDVLAPEELNTKV